MTTIKLNDYRIMCDRQYVDDCRGGVLISGARNQTEAEARARNLGWHISLMAGCPVCEKRYQEAERKAEK